jgi:tyrosyl-tRNA synthetase
MTREEVAEVETAQRERPHERPAQRALAFDLTARVHGRGEAERQVRVAEAAFSSSSGAIHDPEVLDVLYREVGGFPLTEELMRGDVLGIALASGLFPSKGEARRAIAQGGVSFDGRRVEDPDTRIAELVAGRYLLVRAGKKRLAVGRLGS